jgi:hypothetical protein
MATFLLNINIGHGYIVNAYLPGLAEQMSWLKANLSQYYCCEDVTNGFIYLGNVGVNTIRLPVILNRSPGRTWPVLGGLAHTDTGHMSCCALIKDAITIEETTERVALNTELDRLGQLGLDPVLLQQIKQEQFGRWLYSYYSN